jgi:PDZ domain-containing protein
VLLVAVLLVPVPYIVLAPTAPTNTLGFDPGQPGRRVPVCDVRAPTYPTSGTLALTTVGVQEDSPTLFTAVRRWTQSHYAVVPRTLLYPPGQKQKDVDRQNVQQMADSRVDAVQAATNELNYPTNVVHDVVPGGAAAGILQPGDQIMSVDGQAVTTAEQVTTAIRSHKPGDVVTLELHRGPGAQAVKLQVKLGATTGGQARLGVTVSAADATFNLAGVSGPSAGLMFALCIIDKLTPDDLAHGRVIAGTGTITPDGNVGPIGGVQQKLYGAASHGVTEFLVPAANCDEARKADAQGVRLVRIPPSTKTMSSLHAAYQDLVQLRAGRTELPTC